MQPKQRVERVLCHELPDCCPVLVRSLSNKVEMQYSEQFEISEEDEIVYWRNLTPLLSMKIDAYDFNFPVKRPRIQLENGKLIDAFGRISTNGSYSDGYIKTKEIFDSFPPVELSDPNDPENFGKMNKMVGDRIAPFCNLKGLFELTWQGMSMAVFGRAQRKDIGFIGAFIDRIHKHNMEQVKAALDYDILLFSVADDMGFKNGLITKKEFYDTHIFSRYKQLIDMIHKRGGLIYLHSEGNIAELLPSIIDAGFDGIQALTTMDGIDIGEIKQKYGDKIALMGGLLHSPLLDWQTPLEVEKEVDRVFQAAGYNGGLIMGPSAAIDQNCKIENVLTMIRAIHSKKY